MKKIFDIILLLSMMFLLCASITSCGSQNMQESAEPGSVDVDLSKLSGTLAYSQVTNMMYNPDEYIGKTVKATGLYYASYSEETDLYYHLVVVGDETSCCQQGLEFVLKGEHNYPDDYPKERTKIEVTGVFGSYEELGGTYYFLTADDITAIE